MREDRYLVPTFFAALVVYFGVHVAVRVASTNSLGFDEAAQVFIAWRLQPGYLADPPLYSWLQYAVFEVFGTNVLALSVLKNSLLFLTYTFVFLSARVLLQDTRLAIMAALSLLLIPQYAWESQRDLTHSVLAVTLSAATLYVLLRLFREPATRNFVLLGVVLGLGTISKYNYMIFAGTAISAALLRRESREALLDKNLLLSVGIALVIAAPYLYWSVTNLAQATANVYKLGVGADTIFLAGLGSLALATVAFVTPLWLAYLILFPHGFLPSHRARAGDWRPFDLSAYFVVLAVFLVVAIVLFDISKIKDRWLQPMLFTVPIYFLG